MKLTNHIVEHIFDNLGMMSEKSNSIFAPSLEIKSKVIFDENGTEISCSVFVCESVIQQNKMLIAACRLSDDPKEMIAIIALEGSPVYGCSLTIEDNEPKEAAIVVQIKDHLWVPASVFIQASFLAGMEQLRDLGSAFTICEKPDTIFQHLLSFIKFLDQNAR